MLLVAAVSLAPACAARGPALTLPDAAAVAASEAAREDFRATRPAYLDEELVRRLSELAAPALAAALEPGRARAETASAADGWRFGVLDAPEPGAFLFADRSILLTRGALAALPDGDAFQDLVAAAAGRFVSGAFRLDGDAGLAPQPLELPETVGAAVPSVRTSGARPLGDGAADPSAWFHVLSGLVYGERPEFGVASGRSLLLPGADVRLSLPAGSRFEAAGRRRFRAKLPGSSSPAPVLTVREVPVAGDELAVDGSLVGERRLIADLAARLADRAGEAADLAEVVRVRGFFGVRVRRVRPGGDALGGSAEPSPSGLEALLRAPGGLVDLALSCGRETLGACEARFLAVLGTADRLWDAPVPGPLRLAVQAVEQGGPVETVVRRLAAELPDTTEEELLRLNRGWGERELSAGDEVLVIQRESSPGRSAAGVPPERAR